MPAKYKLRNTTAQDYYPFGMPMPGLYGPANSTYRFGFNGKENDNEVKGFGNQQDYGMRIYDTRLARFLSVDPITKDYPELTPYQFASNRPIDGIDMDGLEYYFFGSAKYAEYVGKTSLNNSWKGFESKNIYQVRNEMLQLSKLSADKTPRVIFIQHHSNKEIMSLATGGENSHDAPYYNMASKKWERHEPADIKAEHINMFLNNDKSLDPEKYDAINALSQTLNLLPKYGIAVMGGCLQGNEDLPAAVSKLAPGRLIIMNKDFQSGFSMDKPLSPPPYIDEEYDLVGFQKGWVGAMDGKKFDVSSFEGPINIKLNSSGKIPINVIKYKK